MSKSLKHLLFIFVQSSTDASAASYANFFNLGNNQNSNAESKNPENMKCTRRRLSHPKEEDSYSKRTAVTLEQKRLKVFENLKDFKISLHNNKQNVTDKKNSELIEDSSPDMSVPIKPDEKRGYLLKRAMHTRMGKSWLKRKCTAENGFFYVYHSDENKLPIKLNLGLCEIRV